MKTLYTLVSKEPRDSEYGFLNEDHDLYKLPDPEMTVNSLKEANKLCNEIKNDILERIRDAGDNPFCAPEQISYLEYIRDNLKVVKLEVSFV